MSGNIEKQTALEQKINEMVQQSKVLEAYLTDIISKETTVAKLLEEARLASNAIQNITNNDSSIESLTPIGTGVYLKVVIPKIEKLLINVGSGVAIEKGKDDTLNYIEARIKDYEIALRQLGDQRQQISTRMEQLQHQINQLLSDSRQG